MKKIALFLSIVSFTIFSCSKSEDSTPETGNLPIKIENISEDDGNRTQNITYNGNKIVESSSTRNGIIYKIVYTYNGDFIVKEESFKGTTQEEKTEYVYENNKLKTIFNDETPSQNTDKTKREYTYNPDGTILETKFKFEGGVYVDQKRTNLYTIVNGNLTKRVSTSTYTDTFNGPSGPITNTSISTSTYIYEYDTKNGPFKNILGFNKIGFDELFSANNVIKETSNFSSTNNGQPNPNPQPASVQDYVLSYNANGYLTENKYSYNSSVPSPTGQPPVVVIKTNITKYFY